MIGFLILIVSLYFSRGKIKVVGKKDKMMGLESQRDVLRKKTNGDGKSPKIRIDLSMLWLRVLSIHQEIFFIHMKR